VLRLVDDNCKLLVLYLSLTMYSDLVRLMELENV
jgi:hypothetical protein